MKKKNRIFMFYKRKENPKTNMDEKIHVQEDGTLDLRGVIHIKEREYEGNQSIKIIIIGSSVQSIGETSFCECTHLEEILFEEPCQIKKLEYACFFGCSNLRKIDLPSSIQEFERSVFVGCPLERVILRGACHIEGSCFLINHLTYLHIADSIQTLESVYENAFYQNYRIPLSKTPCKIYIRAEFHSAIKRMFQGRTVEFIGDELVEGHVLK